MAQKRKEESEFKVSDRRLFTADGQLRSDADEEQAPPPVAAATPPAPLPTEPPTPAATANVSTLSDAAPIPPVPQSDIPEPPTATEQQQQHDAYKKSSRDLDTRVELSGHSAKELEMNFERFMASLYMTAMMQLGLMHEQGGQPGVDVIGARQTIDTLGMIGEKTKGNLTPKEQGFLQNCLYELRMAYVEVTNELARPPQAPGPSHRHQRLMQATLTVLGSGTSMGVPTIGCDCAVCRSSDPRDRRTRPSIMLSYRDPRDNTRNVIIDTTPDFREQALRENITQLDAVLYTHTHADHILGIDDLRPLTYHHRPGKMPLYATPRNCEFLRNMFAYIFEATYKFGGLPQVELHPIEGPVELFGARFEPLTVIHGETPILGFRFGSAAYLTDHSEVPDETLDKLRNLDVLFLDALRYKPHPTHSTIERSLKIVEAVKPKRALFTHICHDLPHEATDASLPEGVRLAFDGMKLEFEIY